MLAAAACLGSAGASRPALAATTYPAQPIHLLVPFAPGGSTDALARIMAAGMTQRLGEQIVVENRPGAGGNVAMGMAARAKPDGYTLIIVSSSIVINPSLYKHIPYDPRKSFAPITYLASAPSLLVVNPKEKARTVRELVSDIRAHPGVYNYTSPGIGTAQHLAGALFRQAVGTEIVHVPYGGAGPSVAAVVSGSVQMGFASLPAALPLVRSGALRALAITSTTRSASAPDIPTFAESGYPTVESDHLQGLLAPAGTPRAIVDKLADAAHAVLRDPGTTRRLEDLGFIVVGDSPESFARVIDRQLAKWPGVVKAAGIPVE